MPEMLNGQIERVTFHNPDTGFAVLKVHRRGQRELVTVVGRVTAVTAGEALKATGKWIVDRRHGRQFKADEIEKIKENPAVHGRHPGQAAGGHRGHKEGPRHRRTAAGYASAADGTGAAGAAGEGPVRRFLTIGVGMAGVERSEPPGHPFRGLTSFDPGHPEIQG
jgi:hypothetical protein